MANCGSNELILKSIEELSAKKRRPDHDSVVSHALKHHGLSIEDGRKSLFFLLNSGSIVDKPTSAGFTSLFVKDESNTNIAESTSEDGDQHNNSFLSFLDKVKTPTKEQSQQSLLTPRKIVPQEKSFLNIIEKLSDNISLLTNLLSTERAKSGSLMNENMTLKVEMEKQRASNHGGFPHSPSKPTSNEKIQPLQATMQKASKSTEINEDKQLPQSNIKNEKIQQDLASQRFLKYKSELNTKTYCKTAKENCSEMQHNKKPNNNNIKSKKRNYNINKYSNFEKRAYNQGEEHEWNKNRKSKSNSRNSRFSLDFSNSSQAPHQSSDICSTIRKDGPQQDDKLFDENRKAGTSKRVLLLGDSHVCRVAESNLLSHCFDAKGIGGLHSNQLISKHKGIINSDLPKVEEVIIHVGSNDTSKNVEKDKVVNNISLACRRLREINPNVRIAVSSIFLQKYETPKNLHIVETNAALERFCFSNGWDFVNNSNIPFKHIDQWGMHLTPEGYRLFASNLNTHLISG